MDSSIHDNAGMAKTNIHQVLATKLKELRMARGLTQTALGDKAGCGQSHISRIEKKTMPTGPTVDALNDIAHVLGVEAWELLVDAETTRQRAYQQMILGPRAPDDIVAQHLPPAPGVPPQRTPKKIPAARRVRRR